MPTYVPQHQFQDGQPPDGGQVRNELERVGLSTNNIENSQVSATAAIDQTKLSGSTLHKSAMYVQSITTDAITSNQVIYRGWGHTGNSTATTDEITVTLPNSGFDNTNYQVFVTYLGEKTTGAPTSRADINAWKLHAVASVKGSLPNSTTQFRIGFYSNGGGNFNYILFDWMAIGTKA